MKLSVLFRSFAVFFLAFAVHSVAGSSDASSVKQREEAIRKLRKEFQVPQEDVRRAVVRKLSKKEKGSKKSKKSPAQALFRQCLEQGLSEEECSALLDCDSQCGDDDDCFDKCGGFFFCQQGCLMAGFNSKEECADSCQCIIYQCGDDLACQQQCP